MGLCADQDLKLGDDAKVAEFRAGFTGFPMAQRPPFVLQGDSFASDYFWHGAVMTKFAEDWVKLFTGGKGTFAMTEMEDAALPRRLSGWDGWDASIPGASWCSAPAATTPCSGRGIRR